jgi:hypothetical protein
MFFLLQLLLINGVAVTTGVHETCPHPLSTEYDTLSFDESDLDLHPFQNLTIITCAAGFPRYRAQSSYLLSIYYLQNNNLIGGYQYAVRFLEIEPFNCRGHLLISWIYLHLKSSHRASFYREIALSLDPLCTIHSSLFNNFLILPFILPPTPTLPLHDPFLLAIINTLKSADRDGNSDINLYSIFLSFQRNYPEHIVDSSIYSYELFLNQYERIFSPSSDSPLMIPTLATRLDLSQEWPLEHLVYVFNWSVVQNIFGETVLGLFDAITRLGIPSGITSSTHHLSHNRDVIIKPVGGPYTTRIDINYVIWNFEKNPNVAAQGDQENIGFITDACGREESAYQYDYFTSCTTYWESIPTSMAKWKVIQPKLSTILNKVGIDTLPHLVPTFLPLTIIQFSLLKANFQRLKFPSPSFDFFLGSLRSTSVGDTSSHQPIDILFLGSHNSHREKVHKMFLNLEKEENLKIRFYFQYDAFDFARETLIDQAKVGSLPLPPSPYSYRSC